jgi:adenine-specific DNA-methyltransferase
VRFNAPEGIQLTGKWGGIETVELVSGSMICENGRTKEAVTLKAAYTQKNQMQQYFYGDRESLIDSRGQKITEFYFTSSGKLKIVKARGVETPQTTLKDYGTQGSISTELADLFGLDQSPIDNPKPVEMIKDFIRWFAKPSDIVVDFFSGSATTAHAVMALNAEMGTTRRFILVQLPEICEKGSTAEKSGYSNIAELGRNRIKFAGQRILKKQGSPGVDTGFRTFKIDSTNMADVYYAPDALDKAKLDLFVDNIKPDRTPEDLLFQVMLDWGVDLALPIEKKVIQGKDVFFVDDNALAACFDPHGGIDEAFVKELAKRQPLRVVFRDAGFKDDATKINVEQIFKLLSPATEVKCI